MKRWSILAAKAIAAAVFIPAGTAKLAGVQEMVEIFETLGIGQWLRWVTGALEPVAGSLLFVRGSEAMAALALFCTMIGAILAHLFVLGPSAIPAAGLALICAFLMIAHRGQFEY